MRVLPSALTLCLACLLGNSPARADFMYQFADQSGTATSMFTISGIGGTQEVRIYLREFGSPGDVLSTEQLFGASVQVTFDSPLGIARVQTVGDITANVGFSNLLPSPTVSAISAGLTGDVGFDPFLVPDIDNRIFLGSFLFTGLAPGTISLKALDRDLLTDDTVTGSGTVLDASILDGAATITVQGDGTVTTPAPPNVVLCGSALVGLLVLYIWHARLRRRPGLRWQASNP